MNLTGKGPMGQKAEKAKTDPAYLYAVRELPCAACGKPAPSESHHPRDLPPFDEQGLYKRLPSAGRKSHDHDAIPLCGPDGCHKLFHLRRSEFHRLYGPDYGFIATTRAMLSHMEIDF